MLCRRYGYRNQIQMPSRVVNLYLHQVTVTTHVRNLHQFGLKQRCAIAQSIPNMQDRKITFTHVRAEKTHTCTVLNSVILQTLGCDLIESCSLSLERLHY